jgi:murein L,D-transpeptidase YafK
MFLKAFTCALLALAVGTAAAPPPQADRIIVHKKDRTLQLLRGDIVLRAYKIALGGEPIGPKTCQGDHHTPEGKYTIDGRNAGSNFHRSLHVTYPNPEDRKRATAAHCSPGGDIMIHGLPNGYGFIGASHRLKDWTDGCIAVTDEEIEEIWKLVPDGTPVEIRS